jgi:hypothetical protein
MPRSFSFASSLFLNFYSCRADECHATGFFGKTGRGTDEYCGVQGKKKSTLLLYARHS